MEAGTGWGKTRLVHEFYRSLAARQPEPAYWPASIVEAVPEGPPAEVRKWVYPARFEPDQEAVPEFFWWGLAATARQAGASPVQALAEDLTQVEAHKRGLERRWRQVTGRKERLKDVVDKHKKGLRDSVIDQTASSTADFTFARALDVSVPGLGLLWSAGRMALSQYRQASWSKDYVGTIDAVDDSREDLVEMLAEQLGRFAGAGVPVVIAIEDVHSADGSLVDFLVRLLTGPACPVLVVATGWPGLLDQQNRPAHRLISEVDASQRVRWTPDDLPPLDSEDVSQLVEAMRLDVDADGRGLLAERYPNPLALQLVLDLKPVRRAIKQGRLSLALQQLPTDVRSLYQMMWQELPEEVRDALSLGVLTAPDSISGLFEARAWDPALIQDAARLTPWLELELGELQSRLDEEPVAYGWVRRVDQWLRMCLEPTQHEIAAGAAADLCTAEERRDYYQALATRISLDDGLPRQRQLAHAQLLVALASEDFIDWNETVVDAADVLLTEAAESFDVESLRTIIAVGDAVPAGTQGSDDRDLWRGNLVASAYAAKGDPGEAILRMRSLIEGARRGSGSDNVDILVARGNLATYLGEAGQLDEAVAELQALLADLQRVVGADHPDVLTTRSDLAIFIGKSGRIHDATVQLRELLADRRRVLGADHPDTLLTRSQLAQFLGKGGRPAEAADQLRELLADQQQKLGADHPDTLRTRSDLARFLGESGQFEAAVAELRELLVDQDRVVGADHPDTLVMRGDLAAFQGQAGHRGEAITELRALLADQQQVVGHDHPDTFRTRDNLAAFLGQTGQLDEAVAELWTLLADRQRVVGGLHPDTLTTRRALAFNLGRQGQLDEAIEQLRGLLADQRKVADTDHPDTLITRLYLGRFVGESGQLDDAMEQLHGVVADMQRVLGEQHPDTLTARSYLQELRGRADGVDGE